jgi:squalene-hopene/tetraprenyl-beta-curcumene cyclase
MKTASLLLTLLLPLSTAQASEYLSLRLEIERAISKSNAYLKKNQAKEGSWGDPTIPAFTALALSAALGAPDADPSAPQSPEIESGYAWLRAQQKNDGGIYGKGLASYNTSASIMALMARASVEDEAAILKARRFLLNQQTDWDNRGESDNLMDGGIGYGGSYAHSDLSNTYLALEALSATRALAKDGKHGKQPSLDWKAALQFVSRCQNLEETNDQDWASDDGGFIYSPGITKAGEEELPDGRTALRSYGSMGYAGLLSLIYADLQPDDPRVKAVLLWLGKNYTLEENPGLGAQGLYYYYHVLAKALSTANIPELKLENGKTADWRRDLATRLVSTQREDGSWVNENSRWWENDPILVSTYAILTLEQIHRTLPKE